MPPQPTRVLVVEDEPAISGLLRTYLEREGFSVEVVPRGRTALDVLASRPAGVVLLDVGLPDMEGTEVCRRLRSRGDWTPVIFATARDEEVDRVVGLELGADDYVTKPFSPREVVARVRAVLRRTAATDVSNQGPQAADPARPIAVGQLRIDVLTRRVEAAGQRIELTTTEFDLLVHLAGAPGRVFSRAVLLAEVWGYPPEGPATRTVDVHIAQLRAKLGAAVTLRSVRGVGYAVEP